MVMGLDQNQVWVDENNFLYVAENGRYNFPSVISAKINEALREWDYEDIFFTISDVIKMHTLWVHPWALDEETWPASHVNHTGPRLGWIRVRTFDLELWPCKKTREDEDGS